MGVSSDGVYAVSSHLDRRLVLWNLAERTRGTISTQANIYSAYFIDDRRAFLWQDLDDVVHVETVNGRELKSFEHFPTYGHIIGSDLETYAAANIKWHLYLGEGSDRRPIKRDNAGREVPNTGKLINLSLGPHAKRLLSSGYGLSGYDKKPIKKSPPVEPDAEFSDYRGVVLWSLPTGNPIKKLAGNAAKTHATLSPDGEYVVAVDENGKAFWWDVDTGARHQIARLGSGLYVPSSDPNELGHYNKEGMHLDPSEFPGDFGGGAQIAVQFVSPEHFVILHTYERYASVYKLGDPFARAIVDLGDDPFPSVARYSRNEAIDSAPEANLLVTGQRSKGGINVYRFDPDELTLEKIWAPTP
jgi:WD40 repeat protein